MSLARRVARVTGMLEARREKLRRRAENALRDVDVASQHVARTGGQPDRELLRATSRFLKTYRAAERAGAAPFPRPRT